MASPLARLPAGWHGEILLAVAFAGLAAWELFEIWMLELPLESGPALTILIHSLQIALILAGTAAFVRAWRAKSVHSTALAVLVEKVLCAREDERRRIAFDLHDGIAPLVVSAKQHVDTCADVWQSDPPRALAELGKGIDRLERAVAETRRVLMAVRPSALEAQGLAAAVRGTVEEAAREAGWTASVVTDLGDGDLPPPVETAAFRIVQEALVNAARHAGTASLDVRLVRDARDLLVEVADHGVGFRDAPSSPGRGLGLASMRERAGLLGGTLTVESRPRQGTRVRVRLPLDGAAGGRRL